MAADARLDQQWLLIESQQAQIDGLREDGAALCDCLVAMGIVTRERIQAQVHRLRFEKTRRSHPLDSDERACLAHALSVRELGLNVARAAGKPPVRALRAASRAA